MFGLKISIVVCVQKRSHREFVHLEEGENNGGSLHLSTLASHPQGARIELPHYHCPPSWGERGARGKGQGL